MTPIDDKHLTFSPLSSSIDLSSFDCGDKDLNEFLIDDALKYQQQNLAQTTCIFHKTELVGYFALTCDALVLSKTEKKSSLPRSKRILKNYPAIKIARMGFNTTIHKKGLGRLVIGIVKGLAVNLNDSGVAVKFVTVDAYKNAIGFYQKCGFVENQEASKSQHTVSMRCNIYG